MSATVLALNAGSSSLKFRVFEVRDGDALADPSRAAAATVARGAATTRDGRSELVWSAARTGERKRGIAAGHRAAAADILDELERADLLVPRGTAVSVHRLVHGGTRHLRPQLVDETLLGELRELATVAPLHNAAACDVLDVVRSRFERVPAIAVFDTAFHATLPPHAAHYALPAELTERHGIRRFGFHGLAHRWMAERAACRSARAAVSGRLVTLQLGNGCSAAAIERGRSVDITMGFTPLEGLMMGSRCGDIDAAIVPFLVARENVAAATVERWLETRSGLLGVSGVSADVREVLAAEARGDARAQLAIDMFCYRIRKAIGAFQAALGGLDAVVFGGGVGEHSAEIRARVLAPLGEQGIELDLGLNATGAAERCITRDGSRIEAWVVPVEEEILLARDACRALDELRTRSGSRTLHERPPQQRRALDGDSDLAEV